MSDTDRARDLMADLRASLEPAARLRAASDTDRAKAAKEWFDRWWPAAAPLPRQAFATALAAERAAAVADLRARVEAVAEELELHVANRGKPATGSYDDGVNRAQANAAARLRAAVTDTTGGTQ